MNFKKAIKAGIAPRHISTKLGISRVTASNWLNGHTQPHRLLMGVVVELLANVSAAVAAGDLPAPRDLKGPALDIHIYRVLLKHRA